MTSTTPRRRAVVAAAAAILILAGTAACIPTGDEAAPAAPSGQAAPAGAAAAPSGAVSPNPQATELPSAAKPIARTQGDKGIVGEIYRVERKDGVLTVWAGAKNTSAKDYLSHDWRDGTNMYTLAGSSVVDKKNSKRYMALLDSSGKCLCSEHTGMIQAGETKPLHAQFQAPPQDVTEVDLQLGNMQVVTITIPAG